MITPAIVPVVSKSRAEIVDAVGELKARTEPQLNALLALLKPDLDRIEAYEVQIASWFNDSAGAEAFTAAGAKYRAFVSAKRKERKITSMRKAAKLLGAAFWKVCKLDLGVLERLTTAEARAGLIAESNSGRRTVKIVLNL